MAARKQVKARRKAKARKAVRGRRPAKTRRRAAIAMHVHEDEFVYVLTGELVLVTDRGEQLLKAGMAAGFPHGRTDGHHLINRSKQAATFLEVGTRWPGGDEALFDLAVALSRHCGIEM